MASFYLYNYNQINVCFVQTHANTRYFKLFTAFKESRRKNSILSIIQLLIQPQENEKSAEDNHNNNDINLF